MSGSGGLLWPRLMTGMCGGRGEDDEDEGKDLVEAGGGRGHGEVLAGAGRSGGGEERVGDPLAEAAGAVVVVVVAGPRFPSSSSSSSVSMTMGSGGAAVSAWRLVNTAVVSVGGSFESAVGTSVCPLCPVLLAGRGLLIASSEDAEVCGGLCCSMEAQDGEEEEERGRSGGEAGEPVGFSFSIMVVESQGKSQSVPSSCSSQLPGVCAVSVCLVPAVSLCMCDSN